jgi:biopolymer transport protein TolR
MSRNKKRRLMADINVVPYIDVMLVLLIIFMITAPLLTQGISVDLPAVGAEPLDPDLLSQNEPLILSLDRDGRLYLNYGESPESPIDEEAVLTTTAAVIRRNAETPILIKSDEAVSVGRFAAAMVLLQRAGADSIGIITDPLDTSDEER